MTPRKHRCLRTVLLAATLAGGLHAFPGMPGGIVADASAAENVVAFERDADRVRYERLLHDYRCLKCQNQSLADSGASLAADLRVQIHDRVVEGDDDAAIDDYLVSRYGDFVRYRPRFAEKTAVLWLGPFALLAIGLGAGFVMARRGTRTDAAAHAAVSAAGPSERGRLEEARRLLGGTGAVDVPTEAGAARRGPPADALP